MTVLLADSGGNRASRVVTDANGQQSVIAGGGNINNNYRTSIGASWEPDVWGRLRRSAEAALGDRFDIRRFHDCVLAGGALPLDLLDRRVKQWIAAEQQR